MSQRELRNAIIYHLNSAHCAMRKLVDRERGKSTHVRLVSYGLQDAMVYAVRLENTATCNRIVTIMACAMRTLVLPSGHMATPAEHWERNIDRLALLERDLQRENSTDC
jgi:hypothetical protein